MSRGSRSAFRRATSPPHGWRRATRRGRPDRRDARSSRRSQSNSATVSAVRPNHRFFRSTRTTPHTSPSRSPCRRRDARRERRRVFRAAAGEPDTMEERDRRRRARGASPSNRSADGGRSAGSRSREKITFDGSSSGGVTVFMKIISKPSISHIPLCKIYEQRIETLGIGKFRSDGSIGIGPAVRNELIPSWRPRRRAETPIGSTRSSSSARFDQLDTRRLSSTKTSGGNAYGQRTGSPSTPAIEVPSGAADRPERCPSATRRGDGSGIAAGCACGSPLHLAPSLVPAG